MRWLIGVLMVCMTLLWSDEEIPFQIKDFPQLKEMTLWNPDLLQMHLKLYQGYVKSAAALDRQIKEMSRSGEGRSLEYGALKRRFAWEFDGMRLHELYFEHLGPPSSIEMDSSLQKAIESEFGSINAWKQDFINTGLIRGIGWTVLCFDPVQKKLYNLWIQEHDTGQLMMGKPLVVLDVFEHAYLTQFGLDKEGYINLFLQSLQWKIINKRWNERFSHESMVRK